MNRMGIKELILKADHLIREECMNCEECDNCKYNIDLPNGYLCYTVLTLKERILNKS
jgi:hypothetical protein